MPSISSGGGCCDCCAPVARGICSAVVPLAPAAPEVRDTPASATPLSADAFHRRASIRAPNAAYITHKAASAISNERRNFIAATAASGLLPATVLVRWCAERAEGAWEFCATLRATLSLATIGTMDGGNGLNPETKERPRLWSCAFTSCS